MSNRIKPVLTFYNIFFAIVLCGLWGLEAQNKDERLTASNNLVYEGNTAIEHSFTDAEKLYRKAISQKPTNTKSTYNLGNAYYKSNLFDEALMRLTKAAKTGNKDEKHKAYHNIGNVLMNNKDCKKAVEAYKNALRNNPADDETRYNLALAKECAKEQGGGGNNQDKDKDKNEDQQNEDQKDSDKQQDQNQKNKEEGDNQDDQNKKGDEKNDKGSPNDKDGDEKNRSPKNQTQQGKLSPQQVKNLLEAMNNEENKVQKKMNASKTKGAVIKTDKDW
ncbi:MAG: tetratricopeptide repeat protein [Flavobacteriaceae bacterium]